MSAGRIDLYRQCPYSGFDDMLGVMVGSEGVLGDSLMQIGPRDMGRSSSPMNLAAQRTECFLVSCSAAYTAQDSRCPVKNIFRLHRHDIDAAMLGGTFAKGEHAQLRFDAVDCLSDDSLCVPQSDLPVVLTVHDQKRASNAVENTFECAEL